ncbi:MAG TPA: thiamine-phosphate kinase [Rickettsiales bacterium]|nr:thiamine-phosphate kinase [Rickettsiales bacterium]
MNEFDLIKRYLAPLSAAEPGAFGLTDDAAILSVPLGYELVVTKDAIVQGVHFIGNEPPYQIAQKLLRTNLSDLASMGAKPQSYFLALMLPETIDEAWIAEFTAGLAADQKEFGIILAGGDTVRSPTLSLSLTALGTVLAGQALRRSGAHVGDDIYVTGTIGDASLGLQVALAELPIDEYLLERYRLPQPRLEIGTKLHGIATACMDVSDGLLQDLGHIAQSSGNGAEINWDAIPLSAAAKQILSRIALPYETVLAGGDDYELLFTAPVTQREAIDTLALTAGVPVTRIGVVKEGKEVKVVDKSGKEIYVSKRGYNHFKVG